MRTRKTVERCADRPSLAYKWCSEIRDNEIYPVGCVHVVFTWRDSEGNTVPVLFLKCRVR